MKNKHNVTELPIGAVKGGRGLVTLTGGWVDQYTRTVTDADRPKYQKQLLVLRIEDFRPLDPDNDEDKEYWILCTRPLMFHERSNANFNFADNVLDELEETLEVNEPKLKRKQLEYEGKPEEHLNTGSIFKLQPTKKYINLFNGIGKLASENVWNSGSFTTSFFDRLNQNSKEVLGDSGISSVFKAALTPKQSRRLETTFNLAGKIVDSVASFRGKKSTGEDEIFNGNLEVLVNAEDQNYKIYRIKPIVFGNKILREKLLIQAPGIAFTAQDTQIFGGCTISPIGTKASTCKQQITPSLKSRKCAKEILESKPLNFCEFVSTHHLKESKGVEGILGSFVGCFWTEM